MTQRDPSPPMKTPGLGSLSEASGTWWVGHTRSRFEKAFAWDLHEKGIAYFLPMIRRVVFSGGRKRTRLMPLFPSYVFFAGDEQTHYLAMRTNRLCQTIAVTDQGKLTRELDQVQLALDQQVEMDFYPHAALGKKCRVVSGPLRGIEGIVIQRDEKTRLVLQVSLLARGASLEIAPDLLEPAE